MNDSCDILRRMQQLDAVAWTNPNRRKATEALAEKPLWMGDIFDARDRLTRFAPLLARLFPETAEGLIESPLTPLPAYRAAKGLGGALFAKCDSALPVAGSIKARGGIYEVLCVAERLALEAGVLGGWDDDYARLAEARAREFFGGYEIAMGSTGNLGLSIGISAAALGFRATVHMSADAKAWKKTLLRSKGVDVREYDDDYSAAVAAGRAACAANSACHFVDDERSKELFLGYSVAALRLARQLEEAGVPVDEAHPLHVLLPCGVGGAPGGIAFGLKHLFGDAARCFFVEPTHAPCMLLAFLRGTPDLHVRDAGIDGLTEADGLAVGAPSAFVYNMMRDLVDGACTVADEELHPLLATLWDLERVKIEPSAAAALAALGRFPAPDGGTNIAWLTGGVFVPEEIFAAMLARGRREQGEA